jgi:hypothetical protein
VRKRQVADLAAVLGAIAAIERQVVRLQVTAAE